MVSIGEFWPVDALTGGHSLADGTPDGRRAVVGRPVGSPAVLLVGLTGGIGAGKSTVAAMLAARGAVILDADQVARDVVEPDQPAFAALVEEFGPEVVGTDGRLDRAALAAKAFATPEGTAALDAITHPAIHAEFGRRMIEAPTDAIVVLDVPLLVESKTAAERGYEVVIVVEAPRELRLDRLVGRGLDRDDAAARMEAQATDEERRAVATHLLDNAGDEAALATQVDTLWADLRSRHDDKTATDASADAPQG
jgi:dephospho-CoA kinase